MDVIQNHTKCSVKLLSRYNLLGMNYVSAGWISQLANLVQDTNANLAGATIGRPSMRQEIPRHRGLLSNVIH